MRKVEAVPKIMTKREAERRRFERQLEQFARDPIRGKGRKPRRSRKVEFWWQRRRQPGS